MSTLTKFAADFSKIRQLSSVRRSVSRDLAPMEAKSFDVLTMVKEGFTPKGIRPGSRGQASALESNVAMAPVMWVMRTFGEAQLRMQKRRDARVWDFVEDSDLEMLVDAPNDYYDGDALWKATVLSYVMDGNAYWYKVRNAYGEVIQLWYLPHWSVQPVYPLDRQDFISYYSYSSGVYTPQSVQNQLAVRDVVHFRFGLDPENPRYGLSPLRAVLREVMTDEEAAAFSWSILQNMGVPGVVISPSSDAWRPTPAQRKELGEEIEASYGGSKRGRTLVLDRPTRVDQFGFDANKIMLPSLRDISEERVCAAIGVPAAVVGFGAGLQSTKVGATMRELRRLAWVQCVNPMQKSMGRQVTRQLLPDFVAQTRRFRARFDDSDVSAFQEDEDLFTKSVMAKVQGGVLRVDRAQQMLGLEVDDTQKVYIRAANASIVDENGNPVGGADPAQQAGTEDGGGSVTGDDAEGDDAEVTGGAEDGGNDPDATDDGQKMLRAIAKRLPPHLLAPASNGNGKH
jgi:HK97 family phage portal protein